LIQISESETFFVSVNYPNYISQNLKLMQQKNTITMVDKRPMGVIAGKSDVKHIFSSSFA